jgi:hypothetical protein
LKRLPTQKDSDNRKVSNRDGCNVVHPTEPACGIAHPPGMDRRPTIVERAYELAASGEFSKVSDIAQRLSREGYMSPREHLEGRMIQSALKKACAASRRLKDEDDGAAAAARG